MPPTLTEFWTALYSGNTVIGSVLAFYFTTLVIGLWEGRTHARISETKRRWVSIAVATALGLIGYAGLCAFGRIAFGGDSLYVAAVLILGNVAGKQVLYATTTSMIKPSGPTTITFTGPAEIGAVAGGDIGTMTHDKETPR